MKGRRAYENSMVWLVRLRCKSMLVESCYKLCLDCCSCCNRVSIRAWHALYADNLAAFSDAIHDGVDVHSISLGQLPPPTNLLGRLCWIISCVFIMVLLYVHRLVTVLDHF
ncbi:hypothetical protein Hdeb2414_s0009g00319191 [Helianthus debilis subsp. tardiflorus]